MKHGKQLDGFAERTYRYLAAAAHEAKSWYDAEGNWILDSMPAETRERFWLCFALYAAGEAKLADAVVRKGETLQYGKVRFNIFDNNIAAALLVSHRDKMASDIRKKLERLVRDGFSFKPGNRQPDYQFHGYNDNMPAKGTMGLILGGELLGHQGAVEYGLWNLRQLRALLVRSGINSEYNSPTYSGLAIHAMGEIVEHAENEEARELALGIEERLWIDLAARFHPETGLIAGPYSRAYTVDTIGHLSCMASLLWFALGDMVNPSPMELFEQDCDLVLHHQGDRPFNIVQMCWFAGGSFHIPGKAQRLFHQKQYPFHAVATAEMGDSGPDFPCRPSRIETALHSDFSLGTTMTPFGGGEQTMSYFVTYRKQEKIESFRDVGTVFNKMVINDDVPGTVKHAEAIATNGKKRRVVYSNSGEEDHLHSYSNTIALQSDTTALVLTYPHLALGGQADTGIGPKPLSALSEMVIFPSHFGGAEEILVGGRPRKSWSGSARNGEWIACRRGRLLIGIRPLAYSRTLGTVKVSLEEVNKYQVIRFTFYQGEKRTFSRAELRHIFGGFVAEHASVEEYPSLAAFAKDLSHAQFTDYYWATRRTRYRRPASDQRPALEMEVAWSPGSHEPRIAAIDGKQVETPVVFIDGIKAGSLPFLNEPFQSNPSFFPWKDFSVEWGDWPYAIGDREV